MANALVIGGTGFIGSKIANFLVVENYEVSIIKSTKKKKLDYWEIFLPW